MSGLTAALVFLVVITELVAYLSWWMPGAGAIPAQSIPASASTRWQAPPPTAVHRVEEWSLDRPRAFHEAPMLEAQVVSGSLEPVSERLPTDPLVIVPPEQCGPYGGTWRRLATSPVDIGNSTNRIFYEGLLRYGPLGDEILPNLASSWEEEDSGRAYLFRLRRGVRWSDGAPFTTVDIRFWYEDVLQNRELTPTVPQHFMRGGRLMDLEVIDDYTFRLRFAEPYGLFIQLMASRLSDGLLLPKHYLSRFHAKYASHEELERAALETNLDLWYQLFAQKRDWFNAELPRLSAWILKRPPPARPVLWERNPYYWKVDHEGNQLPYIDRIAIDIYDSETINLKAINGEVGMQGRHLAFNNYALFMENQERAGYRLIQHIDGGDMMNALHVNLNHRDPVMRRLFQDKRFRIALSLAINREELNKACYFGLGVPRQMSPPPGSPFYVPDYASAYTEFDPDEANRLLDELGLTARDRKGMRLRPDGKPMHITIEISSALLYPLAIQLVAEYWTAVGVESEMKLLARELVYRRMQALLHDVTVWVGAGEYQPLPDPRYFFPHNIGSYYALDYVRWYTTGGSLGEKPLPDMMRCIEIYGRIEATTDEEEQIRLFKEIIEINRQNLWAIGLVGELPSPYIVKDNFRNVPEVAVSSFVFRSPGNLACECFAIEGK